MEHTLPFALPGRFWKGNLHTHSTESDGALSPEAVCTFYKQEGYHFLSITDHFLEGYGYPITDGRPYETEDFITIAGAELHTPATYFGDLWHILANGLPYDFAPPAEGETGPELARRALEAGAFVSVAHPAWYSLTEADVEALGHDLHAIETYNGTSHDHNDRPHSWHIYDTMLSKGYRYNALATDDAHFHQGRHDAGLGWAYVKSEALDAESILVALKAGHYYSSTGPQIHAVEFDGRERVTIRCSPVERIFVTGHGPRSAKATGRGMREATLTLERLQDSHYARIVVRDALGRRAWTNPIYFN